LLITTGEKTTPNHSVSKTEQLTDQQLERR